MNEQALPIPTTAAVANWYGSNRMLAARVGDELAGCKWVGVPFAGGMSEVAHIRARTLQVNDLHRHVINLARVISAKGTRAELIYNLKRLPFHPDILEESQQRCLGRERAGKGEGIPACPEVAWATDYFVCSWMGRGGDSGTPAEFKAGISTRWTATGGGSNTRFRSAIRSIAAWGRILERCDFTTLDASEFLESCRDIPTNGIYCDPPFPGPGDKYTFPGSEKLQRRWAEDLARFKSARVVIRYYDHPLVRELYDGWTVVEQPGRDRHNNGEKQELLLINGPSYTAGNTAEAAA